MQTQRQEIERHRGTVRDRERDGERERNRHAEINGRSCRETPRLSERQRAANKDITVRDRESRADPDREREESGGTEQ